MLEILHDLRKPDFEQNGNNKASAHDYLYDEFVQREQKLEQKMTVMDSQSKRQLLLDKSDCVCIINFVQHVRSVCTDLQATAKKPVDSLVDNSVLDQFNNLKL